MNEDILIAIITCPKNIDRIQKQQEMWIPKLKERGFTIEIFDGKRLNTFDDYLSLPLKTKTLCKWALTHGWKHQLKMDDDTHV